MRARATRRRRRLGAQRPEVVDHQRRCLRVLHGARRDRPRRPARRQRQRVRRGEVRRRVHPSARRSASWASRAHPPASCTSTTCASPATASIGEPGEGLKIALRTLDHTRVTIGAQAVGIAQGALDFALGYVKERKQFGKRIADFQGIQFMLADMAMTRGGGPADGLRRRGQVRARRRRPDRSSAPPRSATPPTSP